MCLGVFHVCLHVQYMYVCVLHVYLVTGRLEEGTESPEWKL